MMPTSAQLSPSRARIRVVRRDRGVVLFIALLIMVALSLAGVALIRSVDTATIVTGNLAFKQAAASAADRGIERAIDRLFNPGTLTPTISNKESDMPTENYFASVRLVDGSIPEIPAELVSRSAMGPLNKDLVEDDGADNKTYYVIERMCAAAGPATGSNCNLSSSGLGSDAGTQHYESLSRPGDAYYRVTVRVEGPRNTVAYAQAILR